MSRRDDDDYDGYDEEEDDKPEYKSWQERYESLNEEAWENHDRDDDDPDKWDNQQQRDHVENMRDAAQHEREERERMRDLYGDEADEGHDDRIQRLRDYEQLASNHMANIDGEYEYARPMQDMDPDLRRELEEANNRRWRGNGHDEGCQDEDDDNSDMDIESDEDEEDDDSDMDIESDEDD